MTARALCQSESEFCDAALDERSQLFLHIYGQGLFVLSASLGEELVEMFRDQTTEKERLGMTRLVLRRRSAVADEDEHLTRSAWDFDGTTGRN